MKINFKKTLSISLASIMMLTNNSYIFANKIDNRNKLDNGNKIDSKKNTLTSELSDEMKNDNRYYDVMVYFKKEASYAKASKMSKLYKGDESDNLKKRKAVINEMFETAIKSQSAVLNYLNEEKVKGNVEKYESIYIVNSIHLVAKKNVIYKLSKDKNISKIDINETIKMDKPVPVIKPQTRSSQDLEEIEWNIKAINANQVWDEGVTGKGVTVGIMDTAVDVNHPTLKKKFRGYDKETGRITWEGNYYDAVNGRENIGKNVEASHGSHCAGVILGSENGENGKKINQIGVAPDAKFINVRVFGNDGESSTSGFLQAAQWMLAPGGDASKAPSVINNSWGTGYNRDTWYRKSVKAWREAGILPVFAAGNQSPGEPEPGPGSISVPGGYSESFAVGAVDNHGKLAFFSKRGPSAIPGVEGIKPEVSAPGVNIRSAIRGSYEYMSGTSMAAPHVTGVAALLKSYDNNLSDTRIQKIIEETATPATDKDYPKSPNHGYGYGIVNALSAYSKISDKGNGTVTGKVLSNNKPVAAEISIKETGRNVETDFTDGSFSMKHPAGKYTLKVNAYGYAPYEKEISINKDSKIISNIELKKKNEYSLSGIVEDAAKNKIENASVYLLEDNNVNIDMTNINGEFKTSKVPEGEYTLRVYKEGYKLYDKKVNITSNTNLNVVLKGKDDLIEKEHSHDTGNVNKLSDQNLPVGRSGFESGAVRFIPSKKNGVISTVSAYFYDKTSLFSGDRVSVSIKQLDKRGRVETLLEPKEFSFIAGKWNEFSLEKYNIKADKPYYVIISSPSKYIPGFNIGMDIKGDPDNSFVYTGNNFVSIEKARVYGSLMIRSKILYPKTSEDIEYHVEKPILDPIYPDKKTITGKAKANQQVQIIIGESIRINEVADESGKFTFKLMKTLKPGEEVICYAKDINGVNSEKVVGVALNDISELKKIIELAKNKDKSKASKENIDKLNAIISESEKLIEEIKSIEQTNIEKTNIRDYQVKIDSKINKIKTILIELSPEKKELKKAIDNAKKVRDLAQISPNGLDVSTRKKWVRQREWSTFNNKILNALRIYDKSDSSTSEINIVLKKLMEAQKTYETRLKDGKKYTIIVDNRYNDGRYEGEGRGKNLIASHLIVTLKDGKITYIDITEWNEDPDALEKIKEDGYLDRIINENSLDAIKTVGYEYECEAIVRGLTQAIEKALKEGKDANTDMTPLLNVIDKAKEDLISVHISVDGKVSVDGKELKKDKEWVTQREFDDLKEAIKVAKEKSEDRKLSIDLRNKAITLLEIAIKNFDSSKKTGPTKNDKIVSYKDGKYTVEETGFNKRDKNKFEIEILDGKIKSIKIKKWSDSEDRKTILGEMIKNIIDNNTSDVDVISSSTESSKSLRNAVKKALEEASIKDGSEKDEETNKDKKEEEYKKLKAAHDSLNAEIYSAKKLLYDTKVGKNEELNRKYWIEKDTARDYVKKIKKIILKSKEKNITLEELKTYKNKVKEIENEIKAKRKVVENE